MPKDTTKTKRARRPFCRTHNALKSVCIAHNFTCQDDDGSGDLSFLDGDVIDTAARYGDAFQSNEVLFDLSEIALLSQNGEVGDVPQTW